MADSEETIEQWRQQHKPLAERMHGLIRRYALTTQPDALRDQLSTRLWLVRAVVRQRGDAVALSLLDPRLSTAGEAQAILSEDADDRHAVVEAGGHVD
jgi:hypothetical protein